MLPTELYFDTARLGLMSPSAQQAVSDFTRIGTIGEAHFWLYFEDFLDRGATQLPEQFRQQFPGLQTWPGIPSLKQALVSLAGEEGQQVLLASRSISLVRIGLHQMLQRCSNVLVTDLTWPGYRKNVHHAVKRFGKKLACARIRRALLSGSMSAMELVDFLAGIACRQAVDAVFIPAVTHEGIRLPVAPLCRRLQKHRPTFVMIDGAQEFCHVPSQKTLQVADYYIAGCHKWLGSYLPMRFAIGKHLKSISLGKSGLGSADPLLEFTERIDHRKQTPYGQTIDLAPMFSCAGAVADAIRVGASTQKSFRVRLRNSQLLLERATKFGWKSILPHRSLHSGILLLRTIDPAIRATLPAAVRQYFLRQGIVLSTYPHGVIRVSAPEFPLSSDQLDAWSRAVRLCVHRQPVIRSP